MRRSVHCSLCLWENLYQEDYTLGPDTMGTVIHTFQGRTMSVSIA